MFFCKRAVFLQILAAWGVIFYRATRGKQPPRFRTAIYDFTRENRLW